MEESSTAKGYEQMSHMRDRLPKHTDFWTPAWTSIGLLVWLLIADNVINYAPFAPRTFWALFDVMAHGITALLITIPLFAIDTHTEQKLPLIGLFFFASTLLDADHFVASRSLDITKAMSMRSRPPTHSLTFASLIGIETGIVFNNVRIGWGVFAALASHILRDASTGATPLVWPLPINAIPWWIYYLAEVVLVLISFSVAQDRIRDSL